MEVGIKKDEVTGRVTHVSFLASSFIDEQFLNALVDAIMDYKRGTIIAKSRKSIFRWRSGKLTELGENETPPSPT